MGKILVFQHVPYEILGTFDPMIRERGFRVRYINFGRDPEVIPNVTKYDGLIVLGGPMNVGQADQYPHLTSELEALRSALDHNIPIMGICLGAQLLAKTLGAEVSRCPEKEIGWYDVTPTEEGLRDPVLGHFKDTRKIFEWHGDAFANPPGAVRLAESRAWPNQAYRYGDNAYGFQFHLEVDEALVHRWLSTPRYLEELSALKGRTDPRPFDERRPSISRSLKPLAKMYSALFST